MPAMRAERERIVGNRPGWIARQWVAARHGFTLVEILIVVVILGILAAIVTPLFGAASEDSRRTAFVENLRTFASACELYRVRTGRYPTDGSSGQLPEELEQFIRREHFEQITPIGGLWDTEYMDTGVHAAVGVHFQASAPPSRDTAYMNQISAMIDGSDVNGGFFRRIASERYYWVLQD